MFTIRDGRECFYAWDLDRQIVVEDPSIVEVHFCNRTDECSLVVEVRDEDGIRVANVPNILLQSSFDVRVFGYDGKATLHDKVFKVKPRTRPADYIYTETEVLSVKQLAEELRNDIDERLENIVDEVISNIDIPDVEDIDLSNYYTKEEVDTALEATKEVVYLDLSYTTQSNAHATEEHAAIFERIYSGEEIAVYTNAYSPNAMYVTTEVEVHQNSIRFTAHYTDYINSPVVLSVVKYEATKGASGWALERSYSNVNLATMEDVNDAIANIEIPDGPGGDVDLSDYYTKAETEALIDAIEIPEPDLSGKADKEHTHKLSEITDYVAPVIPSLDGYATEDYVANAITTAFAGIATAEGGAY